MTDYDFIEKLINAKSSEEVNKLVKENTIITFFNRENSKGEFSEKATLSNKKDLLKTYDKAIEKIKKEYNIQDQYKADIEIFELNASSEKVNIAIDSLKIGQFNDSEELREYIINDLYTKEKGYINYDKIANIELLEECFSALEDGMVNLKEKGIKAIFQNDELGAYYFKIEKKLNKENDNYTSLYFKSNSLPEILDKSFKYMAFEVVEPFTEGNPCFDDYAWFKNKFQDRVENIENAIGFLETIQFIEKEGGFVFDELQDLKTNINSKNVNFYFSNDDKEKNYIKISEKYQSFVTENDNEKNKIYMKEIENLSGSESLIKGLLFDNYLDYYGREVLTKGKNVFEKIPNDKELIEKTAELSKMIKDINFEDIKNYVLSETAKLENNIDKKVSLKVADKIIDDFFGNYEEFRNSDSAIKEFIQTNQKEFGLKFVDLKGNTYTETRDNIKGFFNNNIKDEIKRAVIEMIDSEDFGKAKKFNNEKVENFFNKKEELVQDIFNENFKAKFDLKSDEIKVGFINGKKSKKDIFNIEDKYDGMGLKASMDFYFRNEPRLARPVITKSNMIEWLDKLDPKKYNIGFEVKVENYNKENKNIEKNIEKKQEKEMDM